MAQFCAAATGPPGRSAWSIIPPPLTHLPRFIDSYNERRLHSALGYLSRNRYEEEQSRTPVKSAA